MEICELLWGIVTYPTLFFERDEGTVSSPKRPVFSWGGLRARNDRSEELPRDTWRG